MPTVATQAADSEVLAVALFSVQPDGREVIMEHVGLRPYVFRRMHRGAARLAPVMANGEINETRRFWISVDVTSGRTAVGDDGVIRVVHPAHMGALRRMCGAPSTMPAARRGALDA